MDSAEVDAVMTYARTKLTARPDGQDGSEAAKVIAAERARKEPQNCARCDYMAEDGWCGAFNEAPPVEFLTRENECTKFIHYLPF